MVKKESKEKKLTKTDGIWLVSMGVTLIAGLWILWTSKLELTVAHIKFIYSLFLALAIGLSAYYIVFKLEDKKDGKK